MSARLFNYPGSKHRLAEILAQMQPPHNTYVSVFGGTGIDFLFRKPSKSEVFNDLDGNITTTFLALQNETIFHKLHHRLKWAVPIRREVNRCADILEHPTGHTQLEIAYAVLYVGNVTTPHGLRKNSGMMLQKQQLPNAYRRLEEYRNRFGTVIIEQRDFRELITKYDSPSTLFYCDPPYSGTNPYHHKFTPQIHTTRPQGTIRAGKLYRWDGHPIRLPERTIRLLPCRLGET